MPVEFGQITTRPSPFNSGVLLSRSASPEGFATALKRLDVVPYIVVVSFAPTPSKEGLRRKTVDWNRHRGEFVGAGPEQPTVHQIIGSNEKVLITVNIDKSGGEEGIDAGFISFQDELLPQLTEAAFLPVDGYISGPRGRRGYRIKYENPDLQLEINDGVSVSRRQALTEWFKQLPN